MNFISFAFWLFFLIVGVAYWRLPHRAQNVLLLLASYFFYACWDWRFLGLLIASSVFDFTLGLLIDDAETPARRRGFLVVSLSTNLGLLAFFKYYGFFSHELGALFRTVGLTPLLPTLDIVLPVGISFYTFQTMSYAIDVYRGEVRAQRSFVNFATYISFFPQMVAGPIERAKSFLPQVTEPRVWTERRFREGLSLIVTGLFLKIIVADNMAVLVNTVFKTPAAELSGWEIGLAIYAFAFQIYGDFAGYTALARGVGKWLGFDLTTNFRRPYFALDPSDFWRRWHISLSQWLRDYLYISLGGNRRGSFNTYRNLMLTMILGGLWHGANWTFIWWGAFHGVILCGYRMIEVRRGSGARQPLSPAGRLVRRTVMFHLICFSWLLFRADSMTQVGEMVLGLARGGEFTPLASMMLASIVLYCGPLLLVEAWQEWRPSTDYLSDRQWVVRGLAYSYALLMCLFFPPPVASTFIYFQF